MPRGTFTHETKTVMVLWRRTEIAAVLPVV